MKQVVLLLFFINAFVSLNAQDQQRQKEFNLEKGVAAKGYDVVAYFKQGKAVKGSPALAVRYQGITYYFSTTANKDEFKTNAAKYEPQYGGWCAYAMGATGEKVDFDPETFKVINGKLYLFYNRFFTNTLPKWNKDEANLRTKADTNWKKFNN
ncbi:MAG: YHS domain-containing (seleno)protein [Lacibacter sp.]